MWKAPARSAISARCHGRGRERDRAERLVEEAGGLPVVPDRPGPLGVDELEQVEEVPGGVAGPTGEPPPALVELPEQRRALGGAGRSGAPGQREGLPHVGQRGLVEALDEGEHLQRRGGVARQALLVAGERRGEGVVDLEDRVGHRVDLERVEVRGLVEGVVAEVGERAGGTAERADHLAVGEEARGALVVADAGGRGEGPVDLDGAGVERGGAVEERSERREVAERRELLLAALQEALCAPAGRGPCSPRAAPARAR